jgi:hypothetical protein
MDVGLPVVAGMISTAIFALSTLPMLLKAAHTRDLGSYSLGNILLSNVGNVIHSVYVFHLPIGPAWVLHSFYLVTTALMLFWYLRYAARRDRGVLRRRQLDGGRRSTELTTPHGGAGLVVCPDAATPTAP